ncbi:hypothetical protein EIP91_001206 [Steccherinum ochraceum]|uniref:AN1-type domain-containing protein n=1 Tax=Steccherinum ochraceum TaxID=92696 RepID=A0A4R0S153_9APHY|nr:hypothetical protein EIP91_001206 [Steccherinum ochraceum]
MAAPAQVPDNSMLNIGKQCSHNTCYLVEFLPFKCQHCQHSFCGDHFLPQAHQCDKYDESKHNRVAPDCPFCKVPIAIRPGEDPNVRMERHFETDCAVLVGKSAKSSTPRCMKPTCRKVLFSPIPCDKCKQQFCPQHRFPSDHKCAASASSSKAFTPSSGTSTPSSRSAPATTAAMAAIKRAMNNNSSATAPSQPKTNSKTPSASPSKPSPAATRVAASASTQSAASSSSTRSTNPFSSTDRSVSPLTTSHDTTTTTTDNANSNTAATPNVPEPVIPTISTSLFSMNSFRPRPIFASA